MIIKVTYTGKHFQVLHNNVAYVGRSPQEAIAGLVMQSVPILVEKVEMDQQCFEAWNKQKRVSVRKSK